LSALASLSLDGRRALVTGAGRGLGRALALGLAEAGAELVLCGRRDPPLQETSALLTAAGRLPATVVQADVANEENVERLVARAGRIDILVNNAAAAQSEAWQDADEENWMAVLKLNLWAPFRLAQAFAPAMVERGWGRIINIGSVYGSMAPRPHLYPPEWDPSSYFASKHGLHGVTRYLAVRLAPHGVCVNTLSPGGVVTVDQQEELAEPEWERIEAMNRAEVPTQRVGRGEDYTAAAVFLASPGACYVTGHNLIVDGGWSVW
jgi:NAD(P)-dependent dehydrogenase (short-subunit alcohol dehydrogenase family)